MKPETLADIVEYFIVQEEGCRLTLKRENDTIELSMDALPDYTLVAIHRWSRDEIIDVYFDGHRSSSYDYFINDMPVSRDKFYQSIELLLK